MAAKIGHYSRSFNFMGGVPVLYWYTTAFPYGKRYQAV